MESSQLIIGSHVSMRGKDMMEGSVREALSYGANTFMLYTGAPQNTRRKPVEELRIPQAQRLMEENGMEDFVVHAPYLINLANTVKPETYGASVRFLIDEMERTRRMGSELLILHPGSHVGAGAKEGLKSVIRGLDEVLSQSRNVSIALETMSGKGSELGRSFEELAAIYDGVSQNHRLRICFDTCHTHDAGYDIAQNPDKVLSQFDRILGLDQIAVFHINDSKNEKGAAKDRHADIGEGKIGFEPLNYLVHLPEFSHVPHILETPWYPDPENPGKMLPPYRREIAWFRAGRQSAR
ncbi:MAG TPA: deoxyribonuclease IV [Candidatus Eisenbergiella pullicola]|nr:deoxyribonuclease IV [Candidatus Eisenbergiella pullicola]